MAAKAGVERMARLGFGAIQPQAGMAAISEILGSPSSSQLLGSVFFWDRFVLLACSSLQEKVLVSVGKT